MKKKVLIALGFVAVFGIASVGPFNGRYFEIAKNIEIFVNVYKEINANYVDEIDPSKLMKTGIDAMLKSLDPYTNYISEAQVETFRLQSEGRYNGIGARIKKMGDYVTITELYKDCPADKSGVKVGDQIIAINGQDARGKSSDQVIDFLRGSAGTEVNLKVKSLGENGFKKIVLERDEVNIPNVPYSGLISDDIGYIHLSTFTPNASKNVMGAFKELKKLKEDGDLKGLVLDLRGNGGGLLREAVSICNIFLEKGAPVVNTIGKVKERNQSYNTINKAYDEEIPLVVMLDNNSASASEIVSGVLQDMDRAVLIGQKSYGKGLVQNTRDVGYNSKVKMTISKYYIPSGRCIQSVSYSDGAPIQTADSLRAEFKTKNGRKVYDGGGIEPDVQLEKDEYSKLVRTLNRQNIIFEFVNGFYINNKEAPEPGSFSFTDYSSFKNFAVGENIKYKTDTELALESLKKKAIKDGVEQKLKSELDALSSKLKQDISSELDRYEPQITQLIEKEIIGRYHYKEGVIRQDLKTNKEVKEAISILNDKARYNSILKKG